MNRRGLLDRYKNMGHNEFLYWVLAPFIIGMVVYYYIARQPWTIVEKIITFFEIIFPISIIRVYIWGKLFTEKNTVANKLMNCQLRKKYGYNYCAKCPDGYKCADLKV